MAEKRSKSAPLPTREQLIAFIRESPTPVGKRELARAFQVSADNRVAFKELLKSVEESGSVERGRSRRLSAPESLGAAAIVEVTGTDPDGELLAKPLNWEGQGAPPVIYMRPEQRGHPALAPGDRVLAKLKRQRDGTYEGTTLRRLDGAGPRMVGVYENTSAGGIVRPTDKRAKSDFLVLPQDSAGAQAGEIVVIEPLSAARLGRKKARVVERVGSKDEPRAFSLIAIHTLGLPTEFSPQSLEEAAGATVPELDRRTDLRDIPLVTIDGADARDFDDAVWAEPDGSADNPGGWHLLVAIADVANYVLPGSALDRDAYERGNSAYFPDRVVPMLPEKLSNDLCSLRPGEPRACMAAHMWIDKDGRLIRHEFVRGLMRSAARLTYEQVQAARDGKPDDTTGPLMATVIEPLYGAYKALERAREKRGTLDLAIPERQVKLDPDGAVREIVTRPRYDSHRLIEEFMIAANVAAAETLEARRQPCIYRVHDRPDPERLDAVREFLSTLGFNLAKGQVIKPSSFTQILERAAGTAEELLVNQVILRSQAQAVYSPENIGHFGLALRRYAHFTSPIRRYADLVVHRSLIRGLALGKGGLTDTEIEKLEPIAEHISGTERRAAQAERDAVDRYTAAFLAAKVGSVFSGRIGGVTRFGLFVTLDESGADGLVPISTLPDDFYVHDEQAHALVGRRWGRVYRLASPVMVRLLEADPLTGSTVLALVEEEHEGADADAASSRGRRRGAIRSIRGDKKLESSRNGPRRKTGRSSRKT